MYIPAVVSEEEAYRMIDNFDLEASIARRSHVLRAAKGFFSGDLNALQEGLNKAYKNKASPARA